MSHFSYNTWKGRMVALVTMALLTSASAFATDFSGKWSGSSPENNSAGEMFVVLKQDGAKLTGSAGPSESRQFPIINGKAEGDHLVFEIKMGGGTIRFDLMNVGAELKGTARVFEADGDSDSTNIVLKRIS